MKYDKAWLGVFRSYATIGPPGMREKAAAIVAEIEARLAELNAPPESVVTVVAVVLEPVPVTVVVLRPLLEVPVPAPQRIPETLDLFAEVAA